ncbi:UNVERIFIED_CONTAM: hypothetical protein GTU68_030695 [Idotea baltica]|nr:hypothetical protein [Idotea baltica]
MNVKVFETQATLGGKMRCVPSAAGPVDAGPTVLTLRPVFDALFSDLGERLDDHVTLIRQRVLARHFWNDGSHLDLYDSEEENIAAIQAFTGTRSARQFQSFGKTARQLFRAFDAPMMQAPAPSMLRLAGQVATRPWILPRMAPFSTLDDLLRRHFEDQRLVQLFGRYATYVGGSPYLSPALLSLIWQAEAGGVWIVQGGMHQLARSIARLATSRGAEFHFDSKVDRINVEKGVVTGITLAGGQIVTGKTVLFNGDPRALATVELGAACDIVAPQTRRAARSLSAEVWAFAARATGPTLSHHNVFFRDDPRPEFDMLARGELIDDPTIYVCAMDRGQPEPAPALQRFETIANAPALSAESKEEDFTRCQTRTFQTLARFGLRFDSTPGPDSLTTPKDFHRLFPASTGSLYGQSPHGLTAALKRPQARTAIKGLFLAGGGTHPGAGVPMATLSARHAAEAILNDRISTSTYRPTATRGGMSTASATVAEGPSASSDS